MNKKEDNKKCFLCWHNESVRFHDGDVNIKTKLKNEINQINSHEVIILLTHVSYY